MRTATGGGSRPLSPSPWIFEEEIKIEKKMEIYQISIIKNKEISVA
jgi:hypothetical protein